MVPFITGSTPKVYSGCVAYFSYFVILWTQELFIGEAYRDGKGCSIWGIKKSMIQSSISHWLTLRSLGRVWHGVEIVFLIRLLFPNLSSKRTSTKSIHNSILYPDYICLNFDPVKIPSNNYVLTINRIIYVRRIREFEWAFLFSVYIFGGDRHHTSFVPLTSLFHTPNVFFSLHVLSWHY